MIFKAEEKNKFIIPLYLRYFLSFFQGNSSWLSGKLTSGYFSQLCTSRLGAAWCWADTYICRGAGLFHVNPFIQILFRQFITCNRRSIHSLQLCFRKYINFTSISFIYKIASFPISYKNLHNMTTYFVLGRPKLSRA